MKNNKLKMVKCSTDNLCKKKKTRFISVDTRVDNFHTQFMRGRNESESSTGFRFSFGNENDNAFKHI